MSGEPQSVEDGEAAQPVLDAIPGQARRRARLRWLLPLGALAAAAGAIALVFWTAPEAAREPVAPLLPVVRVVEAKPETLRIVIETHGSVAPRTESDLVAEVRGRVTWVSPSLVAGGFFAAGDELLRLDGREHRIALERARAAAALRESDAKLAAAEAGRVRALWERGAASAAELEQLAAREASAEASLAEARASLAQAELDLERTRIAAPFAGRVSERSVDVGQFVSPGAKLARLHATDYAEIRLPIESDDLALLELPLGAVGVEPGLPVRLSARLGGVEAEWPGRVVRSEGQIDPRTRQLHVVARVDDPFDLQGTGRTPLPAGLFVRAEIEGRALEGAFVLPPAALRDGERVYVVDVEGALRVRPVEVARRERERVLVSDGLEAGERVVVSPMRFATDGMRVQTAPGSAP